MKNSILLLIAILLLGCSQKDKIAVEKGLLENQSIVVDDLERNYHLFVPNTPENAPVVFLFHGGGGDFDEILGLTGIKAPYKVWLDIAQEENIIIVVPNGSMGTRLRGWNDCRSDGDNPSTDDVAFILNLLDFIEGKYHSDATKVYATGTSNGGHFAIRLAQEIPDRLTAFAAIVAANAVNSECNDSSEKVSALFMNGTDDPILPYEGGQMTSNRGEVYSTEQTIDYWVQRNLTETSPEISNLNDTNSDDNCSITKYEYKNGANNTEVVLYKVNNGGHTEPSISQRFSPLYLALVGNQNGDIEMANEVWDFFKDKSK